MPILEWLFGSHLPQTAVLQEPYKGCQALSKSPQKASFSFYSLPPPFFFILGLHQPTSLRQPDLDTTAIAWTSSVPSIKAPCKRAAKAFLWPCRKGALLANAGGQRERTGSVPGNSNSLQNQTKQKETQEESAGLHSQGCHSIVLVKFILTPLPPPFPILNP